MFRRQAKERQIIEEPRPEQAPPASTPQLTEPQEQELRTLLAQHAPDMAFPLLAGLICGLTVTDNAAPRKALMLLDVEEVPQTLRDLLHTYEADVDSAVLAGRYLPPEEVFADRNHLTAWMSGVGLAVQLDPAKFMFIMVGPPELKWAQKIAFTFLAFAPQNAAAPDMLPSLDDLQPELIKSRGYFSRQWEQEPDDERRALIGDMVTELRVGYALATAVQDNLNGPHQGLPEGLASLPRTVRREGRKIMPNEPCPCGSGKKYKKCHGAPGAPPLQDGPLPEGA